MDFKFTKIDRIEELHPNILKFFSTFLLNRISAFEQLSLAVKEGDFAEIREYCHAQLGVAGSYNCFQLEEIVSFIQKHAQASNIEAIHSVIPLFADYLNQLKLQYKD